MKKICNSCKKELYYEMFHMNKTTKDGYDRRCKECSKEYSAIRRKERKNGAKLDFFRTSEYKEMRNSLYEKGFKHCTKCMEIKSLQEFNRHIGKPFDMSNECKSCLSLRNEGKDYSKWKRKYNKDKAKVNKFNRKCRIKGNEDTLTNKQWEKIKNEFNHKCPLLKSQNISLEHFIPISLGGGNTYQNVILLDCNLNKSKNNRNPFEWAEKQIKRKKIKRENWDQLINHISKKNKMNVEEYKKYVESFFEKVL